MEQGATVIPVAGWVDAVIARSIASRIAAAAGFRPRACQEIAIVVSELATNLVRHGGGGTLEIVLEGAAFKVTSLDRGPGLRDIASALQDRYSRGRMLDGDNLERSGLGCGLGAVQRLTDRMEIRERSGGGLRVCVWKYLPGENP